MQDVGQTIDQDTCELFTARVPQFGDRAPQPKRSFAITHMENVIDRVRWKVLQVREDVSLCNVSRVSDPRYVRELHSP